MSATPRTQAERHRLRHLPKGDGFAFEEMAGHAEKLELALDSAMSEIAQLRADLITESAIVERASAHVAAWSSEWARRWHWPMEFVHEDHYELCKACGLDMSKFTPAKPDKFGRPVVTQEGAQKS